jgi:hypothetical protein
MINSLRNFTLVTLGAALASLGSITSAAAVDLSFSISGLFRPNPAGYGSFTGIFSFNPDESPPAGPGGILGTVLSNYSITFLGAGGSPYGVWTPEDFNSYIPSFVQFQQGDGGPTVSGLDFHRVDTRFILGSFTTYLFNEPTIGGLGGRGFRDQTGRPYSVNVASFTITPESSAAVPEPGTVVGLSGIVLGWLLTRKFASSKGN